MTDRDIAQDKAVEALIENDYNGSIIAGTGFGKTRVMVSAILSKLDGDKSSKALVLVPFDHLKDRFRDEFDKLIGKKKSAIVCEEMVQFECYASIGKLKASDYKIIVCDEVHLGLTDKCIILYDILDWLYIIITCIVYYVNMQSQPPQSNIWQQYFYIYKSG